MNVELSYSLYCGDYKEYIECIESNSVDLILTDPPYNIAPYSTGNIRFNSRKSINNDIASWDNKIIDIPGLTNEFLRILSPKGNIFIFTNYNQIGEWHANLDPEFDTCQFMVWHKTNPVPNFRKSSFLNSCELIICAWNKGHIWNFSKQSEMHNFIETPICMGKERIKQPKSHPTQKPVKILKHIINIASNENSIVFDPFMGTASTGIAAITEKRRFIGMEIDEEYFKIAKNRIEQEI